ncbi:hypothetical protein [Butyrivibrio sp. XPD2002]|uniref:hypothetical protein n=1 Tax=Butyrivibrio sp. XPD2002 TaxID=1280665 RepID=UPI0004132129|nr:hypothetical protein [Butyrivibrio sp. XPD2002]
MGNERIEIYKESMESIKFSDYEKEHMIHQILNGGAKDGGRMKGKLDIKKLGITIAACLILFSVTALAAGEAVSIVGGNIIGTRTSSFEDLSKIEEKAGMDIIAVESFSNGYTFDYMEVSEAKTQDAEGNDLRSFKGIDLTYAKDGCPDIYIGMDQADMYGDPHDRDTAVREIDGITVHYNYDEYLNLPGDERPTEEELQRTETDNHFFISDGSDERYTSYVSGIDFEIDGIAYIMIGFDIDMSAEDLFGMAEEIITAR